MNVVISLVKQIVMFIVIAFLLISITLIPTGTEEVLEDYQLTFDYKWTIYWNEVKDTCLNLLSGNGLGTTKIGITVSEHIQRYVGRSLLLIILGYVLSLLFGFIKGLLDYKFSRMSQTLIGRVSNILFTSLPDFFIFILLQYSFLLLARSGFIRLDLYGHENWFNIFLPLFALLIFPVFYLSKIVYTELKQAEKNDYVLTAKSKGLHPYWVLNRHIIKNCIQTFMAHGQTVFLFFLSSLPIIELLSAYNGAGYQLMNAILNREFNLTIGYLLVFLLIMYVAVWFNKIILFIWKIERHSTWLTNRSRDQESRVVQKPRGASL
ncbi:ABC transporter permease subunit [Bacillus pinisoli]|uniref:ABC transporter permease subunit n=1 Tax=Bacillus pinisoli TaxID=2901866 RepID=UPI001FF40FB9|nr:ABC transporter permease subunit [Bacillus pinisoli]